jgi:hypothetical protein
MDSLATNLFVLIIGLILGWFADRIFLTLRTIAYRLRTQEPEGGVVGDGVAQPISSRTVGASAGAVVDPMTEEELIAQTNRAVRKMNGRS